MQKTQNFVKKIKVCKKTQSFGPISCKTMKNFEKKTQQKFTMANFLYRMMLTILKKKPSKTNHSSSNKMRNFPRLRYFPELQLWYLKKPVTSNCINQYAFFRSLYYYNAGSTTLEIIKVNKKIRLIYIRARKMQLLIHKNAISGVLLRQLFMKICNRKLYYWRTSVDMQSSTIV